MTVHQAAVAARNSSTSRTLATQAAWIGGFAAVTAIAAQLEIPHQPVPYTLQTLAVLLAGGLLGWRNGALSMFLYLAAGIAGAPVFSGAGFGLIRLLGPTGGYLLAFPVAAAVVGWMVERRQGLGWTAVSMFAGLVVVFTMGTLQLYAVLVRSWGDAFTAGFLIFSWWDVAKLVAATFLVHSLRRRINSAD